MSKLSQGLRLIQANGQVKEFRSGAHAWAASNPFTFGTITLVVGFAVGFLLPF